MQHLYIAKEKFGPFSGTAWSMYINWSGLTQLSEVVSLDGMLGPVALGEVKDSYWPHIVNEDYMLDFFVDLDFLLFGVGGSGRLECPQCDPKTVG
ncbi:MULTISPECIES: hypothetical protein [unclassified Mesorhizobium]|uniref:hypothetical protein n=1 Tax=unclassified Mesorhizobium TaxID=325217 RepID=UPI00193611AA|nr:MULTISPECIES: hypothetical protein [unclassified Mesorhizobium]BCH16224.1 hypothetical protein MesoLjLa_30750 [Mesorhizobium sp. L-2-11]